MYLYTAMCPYDILLYILPYAPIASRPTQNVSKLFVPYIPTTISISTSASIYFLEVDAVAIDAELMSRPRHVDSHVNDMQKMTLDLNWRRDV